MYDLSISWRIIYVIYGLFMTGILACAVGFLLAPVNVRYRDVDHLIGFLTRVGFPYTHHVHDVIHPGKYHWWYLAVNPMAVNISTVRSGVLGSELIIDPASVLFSFVSTMFLLFADY